MVAKRLKSGSIAYYWDMPSWAKKKGCTLPTQALGNDYGPAKQRCDEILNPQFDAWLAGSSAEAVKADKPLVGTFDWLVSVYKSLPKYTRRPEKTRKSYDNALRLVSQHKLKDGRLFGSLSILSIKPATADVLFDRLRSVQEPVLDRDGRPVIGDDGKPLHLDSGADAHCPPRDGLLPYCMELGAPRQARDHSGVKSIRRC